MEFQNIAVGADIEDIERFENKDKTFLERILTPAEIEYCTTKAKPAQHIAARFCAKEAVFKALSGFGEKGIEFNKVEVYHDDGVPFIRFLSDLSQKYQAKISLAHDKTKAIAYVIIIKSHKSGEQE